MDISGVSTPLIVGWLKSINDSTQNEMANLLAVAVMTDAEKVASMISYLNARSSANSAQISGLSAVADAQSAALSADTTSCNDTVSALGG